MSSLCTTVDGDVLIYSIRFTLHPSVTNWKRDVNCFLGGVGGGAVPTVSELSGSAADHVQRIQICGNLIGILNKMPNVFYIPFAKVQFHIFNFFKSIWKCQT